MSERLKSVLTWVIVAGLLSFVGHRLYRIAVNTPVPRSAKLFDCTDPVLNCSFTAPKAYGFTMLIAAPSQLNHDFFGSVRISDESTQTFEFEISSERMTPCNWLERTGPPSAYILTGRFHPKYPALELSAGRRYQITLSFTRTPPTNCSIWMHWIEHAGDRKENARRAIVQQ